MSDKFIEHFPPVDADARAIDTRVRAVTVLEDRAQVTRAGKVHLETGTHRLVVMDTSPTLRDVSLRIELEGATLVDASARRAMRVTRDQAPDSLKPVEAEVRALRRALVKSGRERGRAENAYARVAKILALGADELPGDAAWGVIDPDSWQKNFDDLFARSRELSKRIAEHHFDMQRMTRRFENLSRDWHLAAATQKRVVCWVELLVEVQEVGDVEVELHYVVPNAMWRPMHHATLRGDDLGFETSAVLWQSTGEDWTDAELSFSTAQSSLGTEPPLLSDDKLSAQRKNDEVVVAAREVAVQRSGARGAVPTTAVELPGVDDGGEIRVLKAARPTTVVADGRAHIIAVGKFTAKISRALVAVPELDNAVHLRVTAVNGGDGPVLAGPVELIRDSGTVGWTETLFVAPGEAFDLGFGPEGSLRIARKTDMSERVDEVSRRTHERTRVRLYFSNLSGEVHEVEVTERIPVSEIEHVEIVVNEDDTNILPTIDDDGMSVWNIEVPPSGHAKIVFDWEVRYAPGVRR